MVQCCQRQFAALTPKTCGANDDGAVPTDSTFGPRAGRLAILLPSVMTAMLPKCPLCLAGYASVLGGVGVHVGGGTTLVVLACLSAAAALGVLSYRAPRRHGYGPSLLGLGAIALIAGSRLCGGLQPLSLAGVALLFGASVWNAWPPVRRPE
jgi:hypothetical protein